MVRGRSSTGCWRPSARTSSRRRSSICSRAAPRRAASSSVRKQMSIGFLRGSGPGTSISSCGRLGSRGRRFFDVVARYPDTQFVFLDYCCAKGDELDGAPNATALSLRADQAAHLAGYLSGLMEARRAPPQGRRHLVSIISGEPGFPQQQVLVQGFSTGVRRALPGVEVRSDYSHEYDDQATCERIANRQIDAGSGVVFATAGDCALGALSAAAIRGVWGVASSERSLAPRLAHSRVCVPALRSPRRAECELVPGRTAAAGWGRRARTRRRRRRARRCQPRRSAGDPGQGRPRSCAATSAGSAAARVTATWANKHAYKPTARHGPTRGGTDDTCHVPKPRSGKGLAAPGGTGRHRTGSP